MHPPLTLHRHPISLKSSQDVIQIIPWGNFSKALKRKANFEESKKLRERLQALRKEDAEMNPAHAS
ncbi:hypothetical protein V2J09_009575 [Rumex salicifolius]